MLLILTHEKADFDAIASLLAAHKLFPEGTPLLPRHLNRNVQQFLNLYWDILPFVRPQDWQRRRVDEVVLVDTQNMNSVRGMVKNPKVKVIDHHTGHTPREDWTYQVEPVGANTTILVDMLQAGGHMLSSEEATLLLLGIYEDTGSLTYDTSTARDVRAAAWLFERGAQLDVVRRFLAIPLTPEQQHLYDMLQANADWVRLHGHQIVITTAVAPEGFDDEISSVAHRLRETLTPSALFVLVQLSADVQLVARSSEDSIDVSRVAKALGGGGHSRAAAALVVHESIADVARRVRELLPDVVEPMARVSDIMSYGVQTIQGQQKVAEAARLMRRTGHEGYPVLNEESGEIEGLLTRNAVDRAMSHDLGDLPVSRVMRAGAVTVKPSESIERVQQLMLTEGWGQIPVIGEDTGAENGAREPIGIVTRTDLLNYWFKPAPETSRTDIRSRLAEQLPPPLWAMVQVVGSAAGELNMPLYFVGGLVRDLLLQKPAVDLDMVVEGDAIRLVRRLQGEFGGEVHTHARFGTAKWFVTANIWANISRAAGGADDDGALPATPADELPEAIDFVTARTEFYDEPSALPEVEHGSIKLDLHRRDFTINTLAVRLDGARLGQLLDFYGGVRDLQRGLVRVLHSLSFIDDPTRILRAIRLEQRLEFQIEPRTLELLRSSLPMLARVTGDRIRHEIELALREVQPLRVMERLAELDVMEHIEPGLHWTEEAAAAFEHVPAYLESSLWASALPPESLEFLYFALWLAALPKELQRRTVERLRARKATREDVLNVPRLLRQLQQLAPQPRPSQVERICRPYRSRVLLAARVILHHAPAGDLLDRYYADWQFVKTVLSGDDFRALGLEPGPLYATWLDRLLAARLDGEIHDEAGERALLTELVAASEAEGEGKD